MTFCTEERWNFCTHRELCQSCTGIITHPAFVYCKISTHNMHTHTIINTQKLSTSHTPQPRSRLGVSNGASADPEGKYVQHNVGALGFDGTEEEYYLITETEKRLDASMSAVSFQSFEMKNKAGSPVSQVGWRFNRVFRSQPLNFCFSCLLHSYDAPTEMHSCRCTHIPNF